MSKVPESEREAADSVLLRYYYRNWVMDEIDTLARAIFESEITDREGLIERMEESTDSAINTASVPDQQMIVYVSESSSDGEEAWREANYDLFERGEGRRGNRERDRIGPTIEAWALFTLRHDVIERAESLGLDFDAEFDRTEVIKKLVANSPELAVVWDQHLIRGGEGFGAEEESESEEDDYEFDPTDPDDRPSYRELKRRPTISSSQNDDLKYDHGAYRLWTTREPGARTVTIELLERGRWTTVETYEG